MKYKVIIIGLGNIGMGYDLELDQEEYCLSHSRSINLNPRFELICGVDIQSNLREKFTRYYRKPAYKSIKEAFENNIADIVIIATPTEFHLKTLISVLKMCKPKIIICEKPIAYSIEDAREIVKSCARENVSLFVNYMRRSDPGVLSIKKILDKDKCNEQNKAVVWYTKGFLNNGSHFFNLLEFWFGQYKSAKIIKIYNSSLIYDLQVDLHVEFSRGSAIFLAASEENYSHYSIEIISTIGRIKYDFGGSEITFESNIIDPIIANSKILSPNKIVIENNMNNYQKSVAEELVKFLDKQSYNLCNGNEALQTLVSMINALDESKLKWKN